MVRTASNWPLLLPLFRWVGAAWLLCLAWQIAPRRRTGRRRQRRACWASWGLSAFQWINPKAWLIAVGAAGEYLSPNQPIACQLVRIFLMFLAVGMPCLMVWALLGSGAGRLLHSPARLRAFNVTMALLLVVSVLPVLIED